MVRCSMSSLQKAMRKRYYGGSRKPKRSRVGLVGYSSLVPDIRCCRHPNYAWGRSSVQLVAVLNVWDVVLMARLYCHYYGLFALGLLRIDILGSLEHLPVP